MPCPEAAARTVAFEEDMVILVRTGVVSGHE
jgi:hypothetical protein